MTAAAAIAQLGLLTDTKIAVMPPIDWSDWPYQGSIRALAVHPAFADGALLQ